MYTVKSDMLPEPDRTAEAISLMAETLSDMRAMPHLAGLQFVGEVYNDTDDPERYAVATYSGRITSMLVEPPAFNLLVQEAWQQTAACDCPGVDVDLVFTDFGQAMEEAQIAQDCEDLAGTPTVDPHYLAITLAPNAEVTIRFDRLGAYGVHGF